MKCRDLKVVNLNITEDFYEYKALFRLCTDDHCMDIDLAKISDPGVLEKAKETFEVEESIEEMKEIIMEKIMEASKIESRIHEGKDCCKKADRTIDREIDSLSSS